ncbi:MAG TPA: hypothetical protein VJ895_00855 [Candidatus Nanoarchaeia archaeon]|nr:hypothetical protein [Candidatus Nanoarchaeia archaeon]
MTNPNTRILYGKLKQGDLEKILDIYKNLNFFVTVPLPSTESINEDNKKLKEFEITPDPFPGEPDNKLIIGIRYHKDGNLYVNTAIYPGQNNLKNPKELQLKYDKMVREYFLK